jgi:hypothetical protein
MLVKILLRNRFVYLELKISNMHEADEIYNYFHQLTK